MRPRGTREGELNKPVAAVAGVNVVPRSSPDLPVVEGLDTADGLGRTSSANRLDELVDGLEQALPPQ